MARQRHQVVWPARRVEGVSVIAPKGRNRRFHLAAQVAADQQTTIFADVTTEAHQDGVWKPLEPFRELSNCTGRKQHVSVARDNQITRRNGNASVHGVRSTVVLLSDDRKIEVEMDPPQAAPSIIV
jgi:hypothetical protein